MKDVNLVMCDSIANCKRRKNETCYHDTPHPEGHNCRYVCTNGIGEAALCRLVNFVIVKEEKEL